MTRINLFRMALSARSVDLLSPAKINLDLWITGQRADGFHELDSLVAKTRWGDDLEVAWNPDGSPDADALVFRGEQPSSEARSTGDLDPKNNSILDAIRLWREVTGFWAGQFMVRLRKRIPMGAGLGGGSSNAATTLRALERLELVDGPVDLAKLAASLGSDCPLFLHEGPVRMQGRGERLSPVTEDVRSWLSGRRMVLFKPDVSIATPEAYARLRRLGRYDRPEAVAQCRALRWDPDAGPVEIHNAFLKLLEGWMPSIPIVIRELRGHFGALVGLSGSGSACFAFSSLTPSDSKIRVKEVVEKAWGKAPFLEVVDLE